jgi:arginyl-tRNA--protein-N-Asp/Glu arginylyltransferase
MKISRDKSILKETTKNGWKRMGKIVGKVKNINQR